MTLPAIAVVGAGRVGLSLARALRHSGVSVSVLSRSERALPDNIVAAPDWDGALASAGAIITAVPDDVVATVASQLGSRGMIGRSQVVLHCSGVLDRGALAALDHTGAALGSLHPLMTFASADGEPEALVGSPAVIEGDDRAKALARAIAEVAEMDPILEMTGSEKRAYHAGAVFSANYLVVLAAIAESLAREAGAGDAAPTLYLPLMRRALDNVAELGASEALSGPVVRGDVGTVASHLSALDPSRRALYAALAREALRMAHARGLGADTTAFMGRLLDDH